MSNTKSVHEAHRLQVVSRQFTDRIFDHFTDRALGIRVEEDNLFLFLALDNESSPCPEFGPSPCPLFSTQSETAMEMRESGR